MLSMQVIYSDGEKSLGLHGSMIKCSREQIVIAVPAEQVKLHDEDFDEFWGSEVHQLVWGVESENAFSTTEFTYHDTVNDVALITLTKSA